MRRRPPSYHPSLEESRFNGFIRQYLTQQNPPLEHPVNYAQESDQAVPVEQLCEALERLRQAYPLTPKHDAYVQGWTKCLSHPLFKAFNHYTAYGYTHAIADITCTKEHNSQAVWEETHARHPWFTDALKEQGLEENPLAYIHRAHTSASSDDIHIPTIALGACRDTITQEYVRENREKSYDRATSPSLTAYWYQGYLTALIDTCHVIEYQHYQKTAQKALREEQKALEQQAVAYEQYALACKQEADRIRHAEQEALLYQQQYAAGMTVQNGQAARHTPMQQAAPHTEGFAPAATWTQRVAVQPVDTIEQRAGMSPTEAYFQGLVDDPFGFHTAHVQMRGNNQGHIY